MLSATSKTTSPTTTPPAPELLHVGIDVGSTTTKLVALDSKSKTVIFSDYRRHNALQLKTIQNTLKTLAETYPESKIRLSFCGSGGKALAHQLDVPYVQEVVANAIAIKAEYPQTHCAIELGGQDAKMIFFTQKDGEPVVSDMRMNGSCAGGTGAFLDEIATLLRVQPEELNALAEKGNTQYDVSGRCGVYAKTDIQPLLNRGVSKEDIALSVFHAVAKQTIGGLAQGLTITSPLIFEGGPFTFNPKLVEVFASRLEFTQDEIIIPEQAELIVAKGTALALSSLFKDDTRFFKNAFEATEKLNALASTIDLSDHQDPFFKRNAERSDFYERHPKKAMPYTRLIDKVDTAACPPVLDVYLGIDSGSTTTKFAVLDENDRLIDEFYASNEGEPLEILKNALNALKLRYQNQGISLRIKALGTTGYGELMFAKALRADYHVVETVAHAKATTHFIPDASFILDIGGQDMKAIWLDDGIITDIVVNEACSSGCGSFLESFASTLNIPLDEVAQTAFSSKDPANLGSRCTVFMNSNIVTEQRNGKTPADIMAGLCRSIIENVFTKVVRISNLDSLGDTIVVQGGTFRNDAVLRAIEQYLGRNVLRAPYPGIMGAYGVALLAKEKVLEHKTPSSFVGLDAMEEFSYTQTSGLICPFCTNRCNRSLITFSNGEQFISNNRCSKGEILGDPKDKLVREQLKAHNTQEKEAVNLFEVREKLLFDTYELDTPEPANGITIGIPRVLAFWETMPFWSTFLRELGFTVVLSEKSSQELYESGISQVTSDTICFPAKLVHGHLQSLINKNVDRIFMPIITTVPSENTAATSQSMCAVVKGYSYVIQNSDNPEEKWGGHFDNPLFHWYNTNDRNKQLATYFQTTFNVAKKTCERAIAVADRAMATFHATLTQKGQKIINKAEAEGSYAVILASRPYHNDPFINHDLPRQFCEMGISVLTPDAVPGINEVDLRHSRLDIVNNYHARMLSSAIIAAQSSNLEYVQLVSFGCGHDAYLSDEIVRIMKEISQKTPLVLKIDESENQGPLRIRVRSFIETVNAKRKTHHTHKRHELNDPYAVKYVKKDRSSKTILVPNTSHAFCRLMTSVFSKQGVKAEALDIGREDAIRLGKQYVHNDICFPAQIVIGEALAALESGKYDPDTVAIGTGKYIGDCRLTHYSALLRKALDDAGYSQVPIITNDEDDDKNIHPGFKISLGSSILVALCLPMIDTLEDLLRKIRPYEAVKGSAQAAFDKALDFLLNGLERSGVRGAINGFKKSIDAMKNIAFDRSHPRPQVLIVGEYLLNFHPGANHDIEQYLEDNGLEVIQARMTDVIRKTYFYKRTQVKEYGLDKPLDEKTWYAVADSLFDYAHAIADRIAKKHPLCKPVTRMPELVKESDPVIHHTFDAGEGVLIPGEILHHAKQGCRSFIILQPFGCLPNHVVGRGISKKLKELYPEANILALDYDPDVSFANIENRLQMLIMNTHENFSGRPSTL